MKLCSLIFDAVIGLKLRDEGEKLYKLCLLQKLCYLGSILDNLLKLLHHICQQISILVIGIKTFVDPLCVRDALIYQLFNLHY